MTTTTISSIETLAISKAIATKEASSARDGITAGEYPVDLTVHIAGILKVASDTEKTPTVSIPLKEVLAMFIARSGATRESSIALLGECLTAALTKGVEGTGAIEAAADIDAAFKAVTDRMLGALPKTPVKGAVKAALTVEIL